MNNDLFRKEALDRIESPERLNEMVKITSSRNWMVLFSVVGIVIALIVWSFLGELSYTIKGSGIILQSGGVQEVFAISNGKVEFTFVEAGSKVNKGELIASIEQPELKLRLQNEREKLKDYVNRFKNIAQFGSENIEFKEKFYQEQVEILNKTILTNQERINYIKDKINSQTELLEKGLITKETLHNTKNQFFTIQTENETLENDLKKIFNNIYEIKKENEIELQSLKSEILIVENTIRELFALYQLKSLVYSPFDGKVIEMMINPGMYVSAGSSMISIEPYEISEKLETVIYVNPQEGKKIKKGMKAKIYPSTVEVEEYGYMIGEVLKVSEYPSTFQGMLRTLGNEELIKSFLTQGPPIAITIIPEIDSTTYSGFKWSSIFGPEQEIRSGTLCSSKVIVETKRPISLLIPQKIKTPFIALHKKVRTPNSDSPILKTDHKKPLNSDSLPKKVLSIKPQQYSIQVLATKKKVDIEEVKKIVRTDSLILEKQVNGWFKYTVGKFYSIEEARNFMKQNNLRSNFFVTKIESEE